jgi:hypothetical protein
MELLLRFWCLENLPGPHIETLITSTFIVNSPLRFCEVLLVVSFPTKLVSSHSEFPCKSYLVFGLSISAPGPARPGSRPDLPATDWTVSAVQPNWCSGCFFGPSPDPSGGPPDRPAQRPAPPDLRPNWPAGYFQRPYFSPPINTLLLP